MCIRDRDELSDEEIEPLNIIFNENNHEYFLEKQCTMIKNVFTNEYKNT